MDNLRLPSDTEIIKYTSSSTGPKVPGTTNRGRKKTISLDPQNNSGTSSRGSTPTIPPGLTIERKKAGSAASRRKSTNSGNGDQQHAMVDRVEITKVPVLLNAANSSSNGSLPRDFSFPKSQSPAAGGLAPGESPLNLSLKPTTAATVTSLGGSAAAAASLADLLRGGTGAATTASKIPSEYYACK